MGDQAHRAGRFAAKLPHGGPDGREAPGENFFGPLPRSPPRESLGDRPGRASAEAAWDAAITARLKWPVPARAPPAVTLGGRRRVGRPAVGGTAGGDPDRHGHRRRLAARDCPRGATARSSGATPPHAHDGTRSSSTGSAFAAGSEMADRNAARPCRRARRLPGENSCRRARETPLAVLPPFAARRKTPLGRRDSARRSRLGERLRPGGPAAGLRRSTPGRTGDDGPRSTLATILVRNRRAGRTAAARHFCARVTHRFTRSHGRRDGRGALRRRVLDGAPQRFHFGRRELAVLPFGQIAEFQRTEPHALYFFHRMAGVEKRLPQQIAPRVAQFGFVPRIFARPARAPGARSSRRRACALWSTFASVSGVGRPLTFIQ